MRKDFCAWLEQYGAAHEKLVVLTGDLGFQALESVRDRLGQRFVNAGVSEQNMISIAAGLASEGLEPLCYSIAPFAVFRPTEQIRLDVCLHGLNVKVVGNGGGYGYGIMGATHHALEDIAVMSSMPNMSCFAPATGPDVPTVADAMMATPGASYMRLNFGNFAAGTSLASPFAPVRRVHRAGVDATPRVTVVALGAIVLNALASAPPDVDVFVVSQLPLAQISDELAASIRRTGRLLIVEEHVRRGGLAEHLSLLLLQQGLHPRVAVRNAAGYPSKTYGSQQFHQRESGLDAESLLAVMRDERW